MMLGRLILLASALAACDGSSVRTVGAHRYVVPRTHAISDSDTPFFLPLPDPGDGFSFYLNPEADQPKRNLIRVSERTGMCARAAGTQARINKTVCATAEPVWRGRALNKVSNGVLWTYRLPPDRSGIGAPLIGCWSMIEGSHPGLCTANLGLNDLVLTVHLRDDQIVDLARIYDESVSKLESWKR